MNKRPKILVQKIAKNYVMFKVSGGTHFVLLFVHPLVETFWNDFFLYSSERKFQVEHKNDDFFHETDEKSDYILILFRLISMSK